MTINIPYSRTTENFSANTGKVIGTLPSEYRPSSDFYCCFVITGSTGNLIAYCRASVENNGKITFYTSAAINTTTDLFGGFTYCI